MNALWIFPTPVGVVPMHITHKMEEYSRAFVGAIAALAGCNCSRYSLDDDSVDLSLHKIDIPGCQLSRAQIDIQLKCTKNIAAAGGKFSFPISIKNYNDLRAETVVPRLLVIVHVPPNPEDWLWQTQECLCLHHRAHWLSLANMPPTGNMSSVTLEIPCCNLFDVPFLVNAMYKTANCELP